HSRGRAVDDGGRLVERALHRRHVAGRAAPAARFERGERGRELRRARRVRRERLTPAGLTRVAAEQAGSLLARGADLAGRALAGGREPQRWIESALQPAYLEGDAAGIARRITAALRLDRRPLLVERLVDLRRAAHVRRARTGCGRSLRATRGSRQSFSGQR